MRAQDRADRSPGVELGYFLDCIETNQTPFNDGEAGLRVINMLEAATASLELKGECVYV